MANPSFVPPTPDRIAVREPLTGNNAASGAILERLTLADGSRLIAKTISPELDWIMAATHDEGRAATLFTDGLLDRLPAAIDHTVLGAERDGDRWTIYMRDVGDALYAFDRTLTREESARILEAMVAMHRAFQGAELTGLCDQVSVGTLFSLARARDAIANGTDLELPDLEYAGRTWTLWTLIERGWELVPDVFPADLVDALSRLVDDPAVLADALLARPCTLVHGDFKANNLGAEGERTIAIDWGSLTSYAPGALDFAVFLLGSDHDRPRDEVTDAYRRIAGDLFDEVALDLAYLQAFSFWAMQDAFVATMTDGEELRAVTDHLTWWIPRLRTALERTGIV